MEFLHTMVRVLDLEAALDFYCNKLGLIESRRTDYESGRFTLVFLGTEAQPGFLELTYNWDEQEPYSVGRNFGHIALAVDDIYALCASLQQAGVTILRPPRDGRMAFVRSPDQVSVELLQKGQPLPVQEPWASMQSTGTW